MGIQLAKRGIGNVNGNEPLRMGENGIEKRHSSLLDKRSSFQHTSSITKFS